MALSKVKPTRIYCFICGNVKENEGEKFSLFGDRKTNYMSGEWQLAAISSKKRRSFVMPTFLARI